MFNWIERELGIKVSRLRPPGGEYKVGDSVRALGVDGVVVSTTGQNGAPIQVALKTNGRVIIAVFDKYGRFFRDDVRARKCLEFISRPKTFVMESAVVDAVKHEELKDEEARNVDAIASRNDK